MFLNSINLFQKYGLRHTFYPGWTVVPPDQIFGQHRQKFSMFKFIFDQLFLSKYRFVKTVKYLPGIKMDSDRLKFRPRPAVNKILATPRNFLLQSCLYFYKGLSIRNSPRRKITIRFFSSLLFEMRLIVLRVIRVCGIQWDDARPTRRDNNWGCF